MDHSASYHSAQSQILSVTASTVNNPRRDEIPCQYCDLSMPGPNRYKHTKARHVPPADRKAPHPLSDYKVCDKCNQAWWLDRRHGGKEAYDTATVHKLHYCPKRVGCDTWRLNEQRWPKWVRKVPIGNYGRGGAPRRRRRQRSVQPSNQVALQGHLPTLPIQIDKNAFNFNEPIPSTANQQEILHDLSRAMEYAALHFAHQALDESSREPTEEDLALLRGDSTAARYSLGRGRMTLTRRQQVQYGDLV